MPITPFMGVRISWLMLARNSATEPGPAERRDGCDTKAVFGIGDAGDDSYERPGARRAGLLARLS